MKNYLLYIFIIMFVLVIGYGCKVYSWMVLENPEFNDDMLPSDLDPSVIEKYKVGDVIVQPRIISSDDGQEKLGLFIMFYSKTDTQIVSVKKVQLSINGVIKEYGKQIADEKMSNWKMYPVNEPFYVSGISGEYIDFPKKELKKVQVDLSLDIEAKEDGEAIIDKRIETSFIPKKRRYIE